MGVESRWELPLTPELTRSQYGQEEREASPPFSLFVLNRPDDGLRLFSYCRGGGDGEEQSSLSFSCDGSLWLLGHRRLKNITINLELIQTRGIRLFN